MLSAFILLQLIHYLSGNIPQLLPIVSLSPFVSPLLVSLWYSLSLLLLSAHALSELLQFVLHVFALLGQSHRLHTQLLQVPVNTHSQSTIINHIN